MPYTPDPEDFTQPVGTVKASTAAAEFRALKEYIQDLIADGFAGVTLNTVNVFTANQSVTPTGIIVVAGVANINAALSNTFRIHVIEDTIIMNPTNLTDGMEFTLLVYMGSPGAWEVSFDDMFDVRSGEIDDADGAVSLVACKYDANSASIIAVIT